MCISSATELIHSKGIALKKRKKIFFTVLIMSSFCYVIRIPKLKSCFKFNLNIKLIITLNSQIIDLSR